VDEYYGRPAAAVKRQNHFLHDEKINFKTMSHFSAQKNTLPKHHVYHASHHVLTIKKPRSKRCFPQTPQQKPRFLPKEKIAHRKSTAPPV
jgi:hypothetical protein